ncbi:MAG: hypothetical protein EXR62_08425 [Chloroflexi bacterium]|nr:hypothetical protein [Chloroflexota bacterium]
MVEEQRMELREARIFRGPNLYSPEAAILLELELGELQHLIPAQIPGLMGQMLALMPTLAHRDGVGEVFIAAADEAGNIAPTLQRGLSWEQVVLTLALEIQHLAGGARNKGSTCSAGRSRGTWGGRRVIYGYREEETGVGAGALAVELVRHLVAAHFQAENGGVTGRGIATWERQAFDFSEALDRICRLFAERAPSASMQALLVTAAERDIPALRLSRFTPDLFQLGQGKQQRRILGTMTAETRQIGAAIAGNWSVAAELLQQAGIPTATAATAGGIYRILLVGQQVVSAILAGPAGPVEDCTDELHHETAGILRRMATILGVDVVEIVWKSPDIKRTVTEVGGGIMELRVNPALEPYLQATSASRENICGPILDLLFPAGRESRVPAVVIGGANGKTTTARMLAHILKMAGLKVGLATSDGMYVDATRYMRGDHTGAASAPLVLQDSTVATVILEISRQSILTAGVGVDRIDVALITNLGMKRGIPDGDECLSRRICAEELLLDLVPAKGWAVLPADDFLATQMVGAVHGRLLLFAPVSQEQLPGVKAHLARGGKALTLEPGANGRMVTLWEGEKRTSVLWSYLIPATLEGKALFNVANAMAAAGVALCLGVSLENIRQGLRTFATSFFQTPGRLNVFDQYDFRVIVDQAHTPEAIEAMAGTIRKMRRGRVVCVVGLPMPRPAADLRAMGTAIASVSDRVILTTGPAGEETTLLLRQAVLEADLPPDQLQLIEDEIEAIKYALRQAQPDDLVAIFAVDVTAVWKCVIQFSRYSRVADASAEDGSL